MMEGSGLHLLAIEVTSQCNLACKHCYGNFSGSGKHMPQQWPEKIAAEASELGVRIVNITGGEPLILGNELANYILPFKRRGIRIILTTNGIEIDKSVDRELIEPFDGIQVSLDGTRSTHNRIRGKGSFEKTVNALRILKSWDINPIVMMTLHTENIDEIEAVLDICRQIGVNISIERCSFNVNSKFSFIPSGKLYSAYLFAIKQGIRSYDPCFVAMNYLVKGIAPLQDRPVQGGCTAGIAALAITADLDVLACVRLRQPIGNLRNTTLGELWQGGAILDSLRDRHSLTGICGQCKFSPVCGGCRANAYYMNGNIMAYDPECPIQGQVII